MHTFYGNPKRKKKKNYLRARSRLASADPPLPSPPAGIDLQKKAAKTRSPSDMDLRFLCWQLPPRDALAEADAKASALRRKRGRNAGLPLTNSATVEAETLNRLRELFVPTNFMLHPPLVPAKPLKLEGGVAAALVAATFK